MPGDLVFYCPGFPLLSRAAARLYLAPEAFAGAEELFDGRVIPHDLPPGLYRQGEGPRKEIVSFLVAGVPFYLMVNLLGDLTGMSGSRCRPFWLVHPLPEQRGLAWLAAVGQYPLPGKMLLKRWNSSLKATVHKAHLEVERYCEEMPF